MASVYGTPVASCPKCGAAIGDAQRYAWCVACGEQLPGGVVAEIPQLRAKLAEQAAIGTGPIRLPAAKTYPTLRTLAGAYRVFAYLVLTFGLIACTVAGVQANSLLVALPVLFYTAFVFVVLLAGGEVLAMLPDLPIVRWRPTPFCGRSRSFCRKRPNPLV
jgi:hypothetical protein